MKKCKKFEIHFEGWLFFTETICTIGIQYAKMEERSRDRRVETPRDHFLHFFVLRIIMSKRAIMSFMIIITLITLKTTLYLTCLLCLREPAGFDSVVK